MGSKKEPNTENNFVPKYCQVALISSVKTRKKLITVFIRKTWTRRAVLFSFMYLHIYVIFFYTRLSSKAGVLANLLMFPAVYAAQRVLRIHKSTQLGNLILAYRRKYTSRRKCNGEKMSFFHTMKLKEIYARAGTPRKSWVGVCGALPKPLPYL